PRVVFPRVMQRRQLLAPADQPVGRPRHRRDDDRDLVAGVDLALDPAGHVADAVEVGHRRAAELHHDAGHDPRAVLWFPASVDGLRTGRRAHTYWPLGGAATMQAGDAATTGTRNASPDEVARFAALASSWWDPDGPMRPLHRMNKLRIGWIGDRISPRFPDPARARLLDVGCGAGLAAEALARRGYDVL